jgi:flotillin
MVGDKVRGTCAGEFAKMGLEMVSFTIKEVRDENGFITNMGLPEIERVKKVANIAAAHAARDTAIEQAAAARDAAVAKSAADEKRVAAQAASLALQADAERELEVKKAQYQELVQRQRATADKSYEIQTAILQQQLVAEQVRIQLVEREAQVKVQEAEISRNENELIATQLTAAQVEAKRMTALADANRQRVELLAAGEAEAIRRRGEAEAEVIRMKGEAEAGAMELKAKAYRGYTEAAMLDKMIAALPEVVKAMAEPLGKVDKITIVSTDGSSGTGVSKVTGDFAKVAAQVPALLESMTGVSLGKLFQALPRVDQKIEVEEKTQVRPRPSMNDRALPKV